MRGLNGACGLIFLTVKVEECAKNFLAELLQTKALFAYDERCGHIGIINKSEGLMDAFLPDYTLFQR